MTVLGGGAAAAALPDERRLDRGDRRRIAGLLPASRRGSRRATEKNREGHDDAKHLSHDEPPAPAGCVHEVSPKTLPGVKTESTSPP